MPVTRKPAVKLEVGNKKKVTSFFSMKKVFMLMENCMKIFFQPKTLKFSSLSFDVYIMLFPGISKFWILKSFDKNSKNFEIIFFKFFRKNTRNDFLGFFRYPLVSILASSCDALHLLPLYSTTIFCTLIYK